MQNPDADGNRQHIEKAFGPVDRQKLKKITENVERMKAGKMKMKSAKPDQGFEPEAEAVANKVDGKDVVQDGRVTFSHLRLGSNFYKDDFGVDDRAGTLIHEAAHYFGGGEDDVVGPNSAQGKTLEAAMKAEEKMDKDDRKVQINNPRTNPIMKWEQQGCK